MMELKLHEPERQSFQPIAGEVQLHAFTWWFWIKAGMGLMIGAGLFAVCWLFVASFLLALAGGVGGLALRGLR